MSAPAPCRYLSGNACDRCHRGPRPLETTKWALGMNVCASCSATIQKAGRAGVDARNLPATLPPCVPVAGFSPLTARSLAEALQVEEVRLLVTCRTTASVLAVLRVTESDGDVMIGVSSGAQG